MPFFPQDISSDSGHDPEKILVSKHDCVQVMLIIS